MRLALGAVLCAALVGCATSGVPHELIRSECAGATEGEIVGVPQIRVRPLASDSIPRFDWAAVASEIAYPQFAWRQGQEGTVIVDVTVDSTGSAQRVSARHGEVPLLLAQAAELGVAAARFTPAPKSLVSLQLFVRFSLVPPGPSVPASVTL